jgi:hypothetical protein
MADIELLTPGCGGCGHRDCDDCCKRGKRGKKGHRGHRGHRGHDGPPGPPGFGLLKFSGEAAVDSEGGGPLASYLTDAGVGFGTGSVLTAPSYPVAIARSLRNLATNVLGFIVPQLGSILVELLQNGVPVPGFAILYGPGETGVKTVLAGPTVFAIGSTFDLRVTTTHLGEVDVIDVTATVGVE